MLGVNHWFSMSSDGISSRLCDLQNGRHIGNEIKKLSRLTEALYAGIAAKTVIQLKAMTISA